MNRWSRTLFIVFALVSSAFAQYSFVSMDYPGATLTYVMDINNRAEILGCYLEPSGIMHPFLYANGSYTPLAQQTFLWDYYAEAYRINNNGDVVGTYYEQYMPDGVSHGYVLHKNGEVTVIDYPGADYTLALGINDAGVVVGQYGSLENGFMATAHGFIWNKGVFTPIQPPDAPAAAVMGINARGEVVGWWSQAQFSLPQQGYAWIKGDYLPADVPVTGLLYTTPREITDNGWVVGGYMSDDYVARGYIQKGSVFTSVPYPGAIFSHVMGTNEIGQLVGIYTVDFNTFHGFYAVQIEKGKPAD